MSTKPQILTVLGEQVSLEPISFDPSEKFLVSFDDKYKVPGMTDGEVVALKAIFTKLFSGSGILSSLVSSKTNPLPPCSEDEKNLLLKSLSHRFGSLRNELITERQSQSDSVRLRQITDHLQTLKQYIDFIKKSTACEELDESVLAETVGDLTDEQIQELLRQFVFFVLQGQHPLEQFRGRDPNPKGFVARLSKKPMTDFDHFLDEYRQKKHPVPFPIEKVLQVTKAGVDAMEGEIKDSLQEKVNEIVASLSAVFPEESEFWNNLDASNLDAILDRLVELIQTLQQDIEDCEKQARIDQSHVVDLDDERQRLEQELSALQARLYIAETAQANFEKNSLNNASEAEVEELREQMQQSIDALRREIQQREWEENDLAQRLEEAEQEIEAKNQIVAEKEAALAKCKEIEQTNQQLLKTIGAYQQQLLEAKQRIQECEEIETKAKTLEKTLARRESELVELRKAAGPLTQEIDMHLREKRELEQKREALEADVQETQSLLTKFAAFAESLAQEKSIVLDLLGDIERQRASLVSNDDGILQRMKSLRQTLSQNDAIPSNLGQEVTILLKAVQEESARKEEELTALNRQLQEKEDQINAAKQAMEESNELLQEIRAGRIALNGKGTKYGTDKEFLQAARKAVEAEKDLAEQKVTLEATLAELQAKNDSLVADMAALQTRLQTELEKTRGSLQASQDELAAEREKSVGLQSTVARQESSLTGLQEQLARKEEEMIAAKETLEQERVQTASKISSLQESSLRDCEDRLNALRAEEEAKRQTLLGAQGAEKGTLEKKIQDLLTQITGVEGQRDAFEAELEVEQGKLQMIQANLEQTRIEHEATVNSLQQQIQQLGDEKTKAVGVSASLQAQVTSQASEIEDLRGQVMSDSSEKEKLYEVISKVSAWIASGATTEMPTIDQTLNGKYGLNRIVESFLAVLPKQGEETEETDSSISGLSRCYLVFFMTYVYARHFPTKTDADSSYQSEIVAFLKSILTELYRQLEVGIPGKLESVGAGGIPVQLKSKYLMNILLPLIKQMELVHESGKKGADFLKYSLLDQDQLETLHKLHKIVSDKLRMKDITKTLNLYVTRKTGNVDDDIANLYLRFYHESKTNQEYPVILYTLPDGKEIPKFTFGTETDFTQFLASPAQKATLKVGSPLDKQLVTKPVFSFNLLFYLFLFVVKDYLSSIEGELDKAGCPLPQILKHR